jgi:hypothetical protein
LDRVGQKYRAHRQVPKIIGALLGVILVFAGYVYFVTTEVMAKREGLTDFSKFYASARFFWEGKPVYSPVTNQFFPLLEQHPELVQESLHPNLNLPFQTLLTAPLGLLEHGAAFWAFSVLSMVCGLISVVLLSNAKPESTDRKWVALIYTVLLLAYYPTWVNARLGQTSLIILVPIAFAWLAGRQRHDQAAGIALGIAISLKPFVGLFFIALLAWRRWRLLFWCVVSFLSCSLIALVGLGTDAYQDYLAVSRQVTWYSASWNASLLGFFTRLFGGSENTPLVNQPWIAWGLTAFVSAGLVAAVWWVYSRLYSGHSTVNWDLGFSVTIVAMLLISPLGWMYYFPLLLVPLVAGWTASSSMPRWSRAPLVVAWALSTAPLSLVAPADMNISLASITWESVYFYALALFVCALCLVAQQRKLDPELALSGSGS